MKRPNDMTWCITMVNRSTSKIFKRFLEHNNIKDKPIPNSYPQLQGKVEVYNNVKNEFISEEDISSIDEGRLRYDIFVKAYNEFIIRLFYS
jgi:hypothetical protein